MQFDVLKLPLVRFRGQTNSSDQGPGVGSAPGHSFLIVDFVSVNALGIDGAIRDTQPVVYSVRAPVRAIEKGLAAAWKDTR